MGAFETIDITTEFQKRKELETSSPCKETNDWGWWREGRDKQCLPIGDISLVRTKLG